MATTSPGTAGKGNFPAAGKKRQEVSSLNLGKQTQGSLPCLPHMGWEPGSQEEVGRAAPGGTDRGERDGLLSTGMRRRAQMETETWEQTRQGLHARLRHVDCILQTRAANWWSME